MSEWVWTVEPWKFRMGLECGARPIHLLTKSPVIRKIGYKDASIGANTHGFAVGVFMVYWGREVVGNWKE